MAGQAMVAKQRVPELIRRVCAKLCEYMIRKKNFGLKKSKAKPLPISFSFLLFRAAVRYDY